VRTDAQRPRHLICVVGIGASPSAPKRQRSRSGDRGTANGSRTRPPADLTNLSWHPLLRAACGCLQNMRGGFLNMRNCFLATRTLVTSWTGWRSNSPHRLYDARSLPQKCCSLRLKAAMATDEIRFELWQSDGFHTGHCVVSGPCNPVSRRFNTANAAGLVFRGEGHMRSSRPIASRTGRGGLMRIPTVHRQCIPPLIPQARAAKVKKQWRTTTGVFRGIDEQRSALGNVGPRLHVRVRRKATLSAVLRRRRPSITR
jgi:hypothetical protein